MNWKDPMFWVLIVLLIGLVVMMFFRFRQQKKAQADQVNLLDNLKVGDKVTTHIGIYGKIIKIVETNHGKVFTIETGDKNKSELELDYRYIAGIDDKEQVVYDANGNVVENNNAEEIKVDEVENTEELVKVEKEKTSKSKNKKNDDEIR